MSNLWHITGVNSSALRRSRTTSRPHGYCGTRWEDKIYEQKSGGRENDDYAGRPGGGLMGYGCGRIAEIPLLESRP